MKTISYLCECGKSNLIKTKKRPNPAVPIFFFCGGCGKPNYDFCTKCGHQSPIEYKNQFCIRCGAGDQEIKKGTQCADTWGILNHVTPFVIITACTIISIFKIMNYFEQPILKWQMQQIKNPYPSPWVIWGLFLFFHYLCGRTIITCLIIATESFLTGKKTPSLGIRVVAQWFYYGDKPAEKAEQRLIQQALRIRTRVRWLVRKFRIAERRILQGINK